MNVERERLMAIYDFAYQTLWLKAQPDIELHREALKARALAGYAADLARARVDAREPLSESVARSLWTDLVAAKVAGGLDTIAAIRAAGRERPDLYAAQTRTLPVEAFSPVMSDAPLMPEAQQEVPYVAAGPVERQWGQAIEQRMKRGMTRYEAIFDIGQTDPALWRAYNGEKR